jgi:hypothetical protein
MISGQLERLAHCLADILLSYAAHGLATRAISGMGEITLRDGMVVAAAAHGSAEKRAWLIEREILPDGWSEAAVDLMLYRQGQAGTAHAVGGVELKWWRQEDSGNASNRRRELIKDFIRAGSLYQQVEEFSFVALLSTAGSWSSTASTGGTDQDVIKRLAMVGSQKWNLRQDRGSAALRAAVKSLSGRIPVPNIIHTELVADRSLHNEVSQLAFAIVWAVRKPQNTRILLKADIDMIIDNRGT